MNIIEQNKEKINGILETFRIKSRLLSFISNPIFYFSKILYNKIKRNKKYGEKIKIIRGTRKKYERHKI